MEIPKIDPEFGIHIQCSALEACEAHLWRMGLDLPQEQVERLAGLLSSDEQAQAGKFVFEQDRRRYLIAHAAMRLILGAYLKADPLQIRFSRSMTGKPYLPTGDLSFNLSHSGDLAVLAVAKEREVGVDVEQIRPLPDLEDLMQEIFTAQELKKLHKLNKEERTIAFFRGWTRKEAYLKGRGLGLSTSSREVEVSMLPDETPRLIHVEGEPEEIERWRLIEANIQKQYICTISVEVI